MNRIQIRKYFFFSFFKSIKQSNFIVALLFVLLCWAWMIFTGYLGMQIDKLLYCGKKSCHILTTRRLFMFLLPTKRKLCYRVVSSWCNFDYFYTKLFKIISTQNHLGKTSNFFHIFCFEQYQTYIFYKSYLHWNTFIFDGHIWYWSHVFCPPQSNCKFCLDCWLVKAWKSSSGIGWLKLSNGNISERVNKYYLNLLFLFFEYLGIQNM